MELEFMVPEMAKSEAEWMKIFFSNILLGMKPKHLIFMHCDCQLARIKLSMEKIDISN